MIDNDSTHETPTSPPGIGIGRRLSTAGWGLFLIRIGVSFLLDLGCGIGLIGIASVILLTQAARRFFRRPLEKFWVAAGVIVLLVGVWELYRIPLDLGPVLLIVVGGAMFLAVFSRRRFTSGRAAPGRWCGWCRPRRARHT